jgi:iron complex transport system permease protein
MIKQRKYIFGLFIFLILIIFLGISKGSAAISLNGLLHGEYREILLLRMLRVLAAMAVGCGLSICGVTLQALLRNPLAEPYLLGTSSGAGLGAIVALLCGLSSIFLPLAAFLAAVLSMFLVYFLARENNRIPATSLILSGVIVSILLSGLMVVLISTSPNEALRGLSWWLWGSLQVYDPVLIFIASFVVLIGFFIIGFFAQDLNAISLGEEEAIHLGIQTEGVKKILFFVVSFIVASLVSLCGIIGFVGLIIPHAARFIVGPNHKVLIPTAGLMGAAFMVLCDLLSRTLFVPVEIPVGVITAVVGAPVFIIVLKNRQKI